MMNTLSLIGKTYFSQVDTNNTILANMTNSYYSHDLSVAVVDYTPEMWITKNADGTIVWLETGSSSAGFEHILLRHPVEQFSSFGVTSEEELSQLILNTISDSIPVGTYGSGGTVYQIGDSYLNIVVGSNGYIVDAYNVINDIKNIIFN